MYLADVAVRCPSCGVKFNSRQLVLAVDVGIRNSELRQDMHGEYEQYEPYAVATCPSCGRADWSVKFDPIGEECVLAQPAITPHLQYRAAAMGAEKSRDSYGAGMFYLYAAWCADDNHAYPQAREYRRLAADRFRHSLLDVSCPVANRMEIEYLIGELLRRAGDFEGCRTHYSTVIPHLSGRFAYMARKLQRLADQGSAGAIEFEYAEAT